MTKKEPSAKKNKEVKNRAKTRKYEVKRDRPGQDEFEAFLRFFGEMEGAFDDDGAGAGAGLGSNRSARDLKSIRKMLESLEEEVAGWEDFEKCDPMRPTRNLTQMPDRVGIATAACGTWVNGKEVLHPNQLKSEDVPVREQLTHMTETAAAAKLLGVALPPDPTQVRARLRRLALRYPPDLAPQKHEEFMQAAQRLQHPLQVFSEGMRQWPVGEDSDKLVQLPNPTEDFAAILRKLQISCVQGS